MLNKKEKEACVGGGGGINWKYRDRKWFGIGIKIGKIFRNEYALKMGRWDANKRLKITNLNNKVFGLNFTVTLKYYQYL